MTWFSHIEPCDIVKNAEYNLMHPVRWHTPSGVIHMYVVVITHESKALLQKHEEISDATTFIAADKSLIEFM